MVCLGWSLRMYFVRLLFYQLSLLLVECRQIPWPRCFDASLQVSTVSYCNINYYLDG